MHHRVLLALRLRQSSNSTLIKFGETHKAPKLVLGQAPRFREHGFFRKKSPKPTPKIGLGD